MTTYTEASCPTPDNCRDPWHEHSIVNKKTAQDLLATMVGAHLKSGEWDTSPPEIYAQTAHTLKDLLTSRMPAPYPQPMQIQSKYADGYNQARENMLAVIESVFKEGEPDA